MSRSISSSLSNVNHNGVATSQQPAWPQFTAPSSQPPLDHFVHRNGMCFAGTHLIVDLWQAQSLDDLGLMESCLRQAVEKAGATLLHIHLHHFTPNGGISGVAVLAESHISVHTWPERGFAAFDVFMCGDAQPQRAVEVFKSFFQPQHVNLITEYRGVVAADGMQDAAHNCEVMNGNF